MLELKFKLFSCFSRSQEIKLRSQVSMSESYTKMPQPNELVYLDSETHTHIYTEKHKHFYVRLRWLEPWLIHD